MTVESFCNGIIRSAEIGDQRDYILDRKNDPVIQVVASLNRLKAERRVIQAESSECITFNLSKVGKVELEPTDPQKLQALSEQAKVLGANIAKYQAVLQNLEEFFGDDLKDPTLEGLEKQLRTAQTGIERYQNAITQRGISELASYKNFGKWTVDNISQHPRVLIERQTSEPMIAKYKATVADMESKIKAINAILQGKCV